MRPSGTERPRVPPGARGHALTITLALVLALLGGAASALALADVVAARIAGSRKLDRAAAIGESGLTWLAEAWRRDPSFLGITDADGDGRATTALENAAVGAPVGMDRGTFTLLEVEAIPLGGSVTGRLVTLRASLDGVHVRWRALLGPNILAPIQGVGTIASQSWTGGAHFGSLTSVRGSLFANGDIDVRGQSTVEGDAAAHRAITTSSGGTITGAQTPASPEVQFPDQQAIIDAVVANASAAKAPGFWSDARDSIIVESPVTAMESLAADADRLGGGFADTRTPGMRHLLVQGGAVRLPAGNYALGRLWLDGAALTIRAPAGGGTLVLADLYLTAGARLIVDARDGPLRVVSPRNNVFFEGADVGSADGRRWNGAAWVAGAPSVRLDGGSAAHVWSGTAGQGGRTGPKPARGTTAGYDDWTVKDDSALVVLTSGPDAKGFELFMREGVDLVLANGGRIIGGVQPAEAATAGAPGTPIDALDLLGANAMGFIAWSGGGVLPRLNIDAAATPGRASRVVGLAYGGFEAVIGSQGRFTGAFVGKSMNSKGEVLYDPRLAGLVQEAEPGSEHVVARWRIER